MREERRMKRYCMNCMREIDTGMLCPDCFNREIPETVPHQLKPGTVLNGKYLVGNIIGEGGFGITYIGRDLVLETKVAIKEFYPAGRINRNNQISSNLAISTESQKADIRKGREKFLEEARNIARFSSEPGIVNVKDFFEENETAYIIMEYLEGKTMSAYIREYGPMDAGKVRRLTIPLVEALAKIHKLGVIHRDISPDNIMYLNQGSWKLMDFGSARYFMKQGQELTSTVKHGYAPEEQYTSTGRQGPWTDVYGLCATMYKCVTGITPEDAIGRMAHDSLKRPSELGVRISPEFEQILMRGLAVHAKDRFQSMDELLRVLKGSVQESLGSENAKDPDATMYAEQTYDAVQPSVYSQPALYDPQTGKRIGDASGGRKKRSMIPAVLAGIAVLAAAVFVIWNFMEKHVEEVEILGDYYVTGCKEVLKVRESRDEDSKVLTKLDNGEKVSLIEETADDCWKVYVEAEEVTGYLDCRYLTDDRKASMEPEEQYVNVPGGEELAVLSEPDGNSPAVAALTRGEEITVLAAPEEAYVYIYAAKSKIYGYVEEDKLSDEKPEEELDPQKEDEAEKVWYFVPATEDTINMRSLSRHDSDLVGVVQRGELLRWYGKTGSGLGSDGVIHDWYYVMREDGIYGWVRSDLVSPVDMEE